MEAGKGGISLGIHHDLMSFVTQSDLVTSNRAAWACLDHPAWGRLGFVGVYGPNDSVGRCCLWAKLLLALEPLYQWFFMGDFNMVLNPHDKKGGEWAPLGGRETRLWAQLARKFFCFLFYPCYFYKDTFWNLFYPCF